MTDHTPTPWECYLIPNREPFYGLRRIGHEKDEAEIVDTFMDTAVLSKEDAAYIVKAVNAHAVLVEALENIAGVGFGLWASGTLSDEQKARFANTYRQDAKAALAKVGAI